MRVLHGLLAAGALLLGSGFASTAVHRPMPSTWYKCATGASLEVVGTGTRCTFAPVVVLDAMTECAAGWWVVVDGAAWPAGADACTNGTRTVNRSCAPRDTLVVVPKGGDRCERVSVRAPEPPKTPVTA